MISHLEIVKIQITSHGVEHWTAYLAGTFLLNDFHARYTPLDGLGRGAGFFPPTPPTPNTIQLNQGAEVVGWGPINSRGKTAKRSHQLQAKQL